MTTLIKSTISVLFFISLFSCRENQTTTEGKELNHSTKATSTKLTKDSILLHLGKRVLSSIKENDFENFVRFIHPGLALRFSPYGYVDTTSDIVLTSESFLQKRREMIKLNWGHYDGSGDPILLTMDDYFSKFVYNADFLNAKIISLNTIKGFGNSLNNLEQVYTNCDYVEYYFPGFDKKYEGMDWCTLRLIFKKHVDTYYLVGIVHDQWTI